MARELDAFCNGYIEAALWSSTDDDDEPLDSNYYTEDITKKALAEMRSDCRSFVSMNQSLLDIYVSEGRSWADAGHDFWLTRNGHGAGFWDRGSSVGDALSKKAKEYGSQDLYVSRGKVHVL